MSIYISLLLLVMPGFIARKIYKQTNNIRESLVQSEETLYCLLNSLVVFFMLFLGLGILSFCFPWAVSMFDLNFLIVCFNDVIFIFKYAFASVLCSLLLGLSTHKLLKGYAYLINIVRDKRDIGELSISHTIFDDMFNDGRNHFVAIFKDDKMVARGEIRSSVEHYKEFCLEAVEDDVELLEKMGGKLPKFNRIYYDAKIGLAIKEYDMPIS